MNGMLDLQALEGYTWRSLWNHFDVLPTSGGIAGQAVGSGFHGSAPQFVCWAGSWNVF